MQGLVKSGTTSTRILEDDQIVNEISRLNNSSTVRDLVECK